MSIKLTRTWGLMVIVVCIAMLIFPPWVAIQSFPVGKSETFQGYFLLFEKPSSYDLTLHRPDRPYVLSVDYSRLGLQLAAWLLLSLVFVLRTSSKNSTK